MDDDIEDPTQLAEAYHEEFRQAEISDFRRAAIMIAAHMLKNIERAVEENKKECNSQAPLYDAVSVCFALQLPFPKWLQLRLSAAVLGGQLHYLKQKQDYYAWFEELIVTRTAELIRSNHKIGPEFYKDIAASLKNIGFNLTPRKVKTRYFQSFRKKLEAERALAETRGLDYNDRAIRFLFSGGFFGEAEPKKRATYKRGAHKNSKKAAPKWNK